MTVDEVQARDPHVPLDRRGTLPSETSVTRFRPTAPARLLLLVLSLVRPRVDHRGLQDPWLPSSHSGPGTTRKSAFLSENHHLWVCSVFPGPVSVVEGERLRPGQGGVAESTGTRDRSRCGPEGTGLRGCAGTCASEGIYGDGRQAERRSSITNVPQNQGSHLKTFR